MDARSNGTRGVRLALLGLTLAASSFGPSVLRVERAALAQGRPMIDHIEPTSGPPGTRVQIVGRGFRSNARVLFNERELTPVERLPERLTVELPANATSGRFVVAHGTDEVESRDVFRITAAAPAPRVTAIEPTSAGPGAEVVIRGENFGSVPGDNQVRLGNLPMVVRSADASQLRVIVPDGAATGAIVVHTAGGEVSGPTLTVAARVYVREFVPGACSPGGTVTLRGSGFSATAANNRVTLGGRPVRITRATASEVDFQVPPDATAGGRIIIDVQGSGRFETGGSLRVAPAPVISAVEPLQGAPGARVTLRGERFGTDASAIQLQLGDVAAQVVTVAPTSLVAVVPRAAGGHWRLTVAGIGPVEAQGEFRVLQAVSLAEFTPRTGDPGDRVTLRGTGFSPNAAENSVRLGTTLAAVQTATPTELVVQVPADARSGQWSVTVTGNGEARLREPFVVTQRPRITALEPDRGIAGERITLRGSNFPADRALFQVRLDETDCEVESAAREAITVRVPRGLLPGAHHFSVLTRLQGTGRGEMDFTLLIPSRITAVEPAGAPVGAHVVVRGEGFEADPRQVQLHLGTQALRPVRASTTELEFVVPRNAASGELVLESPTRQTARSPFRVTVPPTLATFAPAQGAAGARVTLRGRNFGTDAAAVTVRLGERDCTVAEVHPDNVVVTLPEGVATGRFSVTVREQGTVQAPRDFRVTGAPAAPPAPAPPAPAAGH